MVSSHPDFLVNNPGYYFPGLHFVESPEHPILTPGVGKQFVYKLMVCLAHGRGEVAATEDNAPIHPPINPVRPETPP